ncbi:hypothetical protein [Streptomyces tirandamycinicus]|uniref:hypothetical protein n=1 Tax=Streptomyces tirandamycinicus TaxID=2174846 RepID=UPI0011B25059|nr:hypothetical protein [Streptomyces tirandamycinicus]
MRRGPVAARGAGPVFHWYALRWSPRPGRPEPAPLPGEMTPHAPHAPHALLAVGVPAGTAAGGPRARERRALVTEQRERQALAKE